MWLPLFGIVLAKDWQFSPPVEGSKFRVSYRNAYGIYARGLICQASTNSPIEIADVRRLYPKKEADVLELIQPAEFGRRRIGIRGTLFVKNFEIWITVDSWSLPSPGVSSRLISYSESAIELAAPNFQRKELTIRNKSDKSLYINMGATVSAENYFICLPPDAVAGLPESWRGQVVGLWEAEGSGEAEVKEFR
jgi:hypothetical protein